MDGDADGDGGGMSGRVQSSSPVLGCRPDSPFRPIPCVPARSSVWWGFGFEEGYKTLAWQLRSLHSQLLDDYIVAIGQSHALTQCVATAFNLIGKEWRDHVTGDRQNGTAIATLSRNRVGSKAPQDWVGGRNTTWPTSYP